MSGYLGEYDYSAGIIPGTTGNADPWRPGVAGDAGGAIGTGTGRLGYQTVEGGGGVGNAFAAAKRWINEPFTTPMSSVDVFLLIGVVIVAVMLWNLILYHVRIAAEAI